MMMAKGLVIAIFAAGVAMCFRCSISIAQEVRTLFPDLSIQFVCENKDTARMENDIERFLQDAGFRFLNLAQIRREHRSSIDGEVRIVSIDNMRRIVDFRSLPYPRGRYVVRLNSPPPTQRSNIIEEALQAFVTDKLACEVRQVNRQSNGTEAQDLHENDVQRIEKLFREAEELRRPHL